MFAIEVPGLSLRDTFASRQSLMWDLCMTLDGPCWLVTDGGKACKASQRGDRLLITGSEEDFFDTWFDYFDMSVDYTELDREARRLCLPISRAARLARGVRMLNIDPFESMLTQALWWGCDSTAAKAKLRAVCRLTGNVKKKSYNGVGAVEHVFIPGYDDLMANLWRLEGVLSRRDVNKVVSLYNWFEDLSGLLVAPEGQAIDVDCVRALLSGSGLFRPVQVNRVMRDAYGVRDRLCAPKRLASEVHSAMWIEGEEEMNEELNEALHGKAAYAGLLMQSAYGV